MKCKNKSKLSKMLSVEIAVICVVTVVTSGCAQSYHLSPYHLPYQSFMGDATPYRQLTYQFMPSISTSGGHSLIGGGRVVEAVKAHPLHYSSILGGSPYQSSPLYQSGAASQPPSTYYSGFYNGNKHRNPSKSRPSMYSSLHSAPPSYLQSALPTTVSSSPQYHSYRQPSAAPPPPPPSYRQYLPSTSRFPPRVQHASMDTYREALDLFSEVVRKLEKETIPGFGSMSQTQGYTQLSPIYSNGIYDSPSGTGASSSPVSGLPHHLDSIMGPDFLNRAHKLYNKIIKEQNYNKGSSPPPPPPPPPSSSYYPTSSSASRGHPINGLSYLENTIQPGSGRSTNTPYSYTRASPYSRNLPIDRITPDSPLERQLVDTVRALEVKIDIDQPQNTNSHRQIENDDDDEDEMSTSESRFVPQQLNYQQPPPPNFIRNQLFDNYAPSPPPPPPSSAFSPPSTQSVQIPSVSPPSPPPSTPPQLPEILPQFNFNTIPLNENDFVEHPLPYNEYEELIKEIASNHNY